MVSWESSDGRGKVPCLVWLSLLGPLPPALCCASMKKVGRCVAPRPSATAGWKAEQLVFLPESGWNEEAKLRGQEERTGWRWEDGQWER